MQIARVMMRKLSPRAAKNGRETVARHVVWPAHRRPPFAPLRARNLHVRGGTMMTVYA